MVLRRQCNRAAPSRTRVRTAASLAAAALWALASAQTDPAATARLPDPEELMARPAEGEFRLADDLHPAAEILEPSPLQFIAPAAGTRVEIRARQWVLLELTGEEGEPLAGQPVELVWHPAELSVTVAGEPVEAVIFYPDSYPEGLGRATLGETGEDGRLRFEVQASAPFEATLGAYAPRTTSRPLSLSFIDPTDAESPWDGTFEFRRRNGSTTLELRPYSVGLLLRPGTPLSDVSEAARRLGLTFGEDSRAGLVELVSPEPLSLSTRRIVSRALREALGAVVRAAGPVAQLPGSAEWVVLDEVIYVRFQEPADGAVDCEDRLTGEDIVDPRPTEYAPGECRFVVSGEAAIDPLEAALRLDRDPEIIYAHPEVAQRFLLRSDDDPCDTEAEEREPWCDSGYHRQWNIENTGKWGGVPDADADVREAWQFTWGDHRTTIAVIDLGFHAGHWDLEPNLWNDPLVSPEPGIVLIEAVPTAQLMPEPDDESISHGTKAAGVAAARGGNTYRRGGFTGVCPRCRLLMIRVPAGSVTSDMRDAFKAAVDNGADVISMSLGFPLITANIESDIDFWTKYWTGEAQTQIDATAAQGIVMAFAMDNAPLDHCVSGSDSSTLDSVIAVGGITDQAQRTRAGLWQALGYGNCMDVLAPTGGGKAHIATTSVKYEEGAPPAKTDFVYDFHGTSAATPLVAAVAALMRNVMLRAVAPAPPVLHGGRPPAPAADPGPAPLVIRQILQDTADKVDPDHAGYDPETGYSRPACSTSTHAFGRINAFEAVRLLAPRARGGRGNRDLFLRDHHLDWGNTEQPSHVRFASPREAIGHFQSPDIRFEPGEQSCAQAMEPPQFAALPAAGPEPGQGGCYYVRVRNRGHEPVGSATLSLYAGVFGDQLPESSGTLLQTAGAGQQPTDAAWQLVGAADVKELGYSGASSAGCPQRPVPSCDGVADAAAIVGFRSEAIAWDKDAEHLALLAVGVSDEDPLGIADAGAADPGQGTDASSAAHLLMSQIVGDNNVALWTTARLDPLTGQVLGAAAEPASGPAAECPQTPE